VYDESGANVRGSRKVRTFMGRTEIGEIEEIGDGYRKVDHAETIPSTIYTL
jgi:hypothetical protein